MDEIPEIAINIETVQVVETTRKLRVRWGPEQDLQTFQVLKPVLRKQLTKAGLKTNYKSSRA